MIVTLVVIAVDCNGGGWCGVLLGVWGKKGGILIFLISNTNCFKNI